MAKIVVEIVNHSGIRQDCRAFDSFPIQIGRGYDNDLILFDPYISGTHVEIKEDENGWYLNDVSAQNGVMMNEKVLERKYARLKSGDEIQLGKTRLRFLSPAHPVASALKLNYTNRFYKKISQPVVTLIILAVLLNVEFFDHYMTSYESLTLEKFISRAVMLLGSMIVWAGIWAFVGRLIKNSTHFCAQLNLNALFFIVGFIFINLSVYAGYGVNSQALEAVLILGFYGIFFTLLILGNLQLATNLPLRKQIISAVSLTAVIYAVVALAYFNSQNEFHPDPDHFGVLKPPFIHGVTQPYEQFLKDAQEVFN